MMKWTYILVIILGFSFQGAAQQATQFTQFQYAKAFYNPADISADKALSITGRIRDQWSNLIGGPAAQTIMAELPRINQNIGFGLILNRETIGIQERNDITGIYSYHLQLSKAELSLGLQFSYRQFVNDFTKEGLIAIDGFEQDPSIDLVRFNTGIFNVGFGLSLRGDKYFVGISVPRTVRSDIGLSEVTGSQEIRQIYGLAGLELNLNPYWDMRPGVLFKYAEGVPFDLDLQNNFIYDNQVHLGINLRTGGTQNSVFESISFLIGFEFTPSIFASLSYDFTATPIREYENGSFELLLRYTAFKDKSPKSIQNPRYY